MKNTTLLMCLGIFLITACEQEKISEIDLSGKWTYELISSGEQGTIDLPSTLDDAAIGAEHNLPLTLTNDVLSNLARKHQYIGEVRYEKQIEIPDEWTGKNALLELERILWKSTVYVNDEEVGTNNSLTAPHLYNLGRLLTKGENKLTVVVDNSNLFPLINVTSDKYPDPVNQEMAHGYTNHTQIKWNGILGEMSLRQEDAVKPQQIKVGYDLTKDIISVKYRVSETVKDPILLEIFDLNGSNLLFSREVEQKEGDMVEYTFPKPETLQLWDEFNTETYLLKLGPKGHQSETTFGLRDIQNENGVLSLNGNPIFLRGNLECSIFPLTGRPPLEKEEWLKLYKQAKAYGLNHIRFHSWCPPKAAFEAGDEMGMYLQAELPHWSLRVGEDQSTTEFLKEEAFRLLNEYGNHPSFVMMSLGNELQGDAATLRTMTSELQNYDKRRLYATTTFSFQRPLGVVPQEEDEYFVTQWTDKGWIRGQGIFNDQAPHFNADYSERVDHIDIPVISHEIGQYSVYPDMSEIDKYTGVLEPMNFKAIRKDLEDKGLLDQADMFTLSSGKLAALLYKEEIERALKTRSFDGFQLLQLQDFPGQGTALVGLLNAFWETKGIISPEEFREFNSEVVPLARYEKSNYEKGETFTAEIQIANFHKPYQGANVSAKIVDEKGEVKEETRFEGIDLMLGLSDTIGQISYLVDSEVNERLQLVVEIDDTSYRNRWSFWTYPNNVTLDSDEVVYTRNRNEAERALESGKKVLYNPSYEQLEGVEGRFVPVFWSPVHFPDQPSTMGLLIDPEHSAFDEFATSFHSDWQWWDLCKQSKAIDVSAVNAKPIVQVIDNFVTNRKLATVFEAKVGTGKLILTSIDLNNILDQRPAARQLRKSLIQYMEGADFEPQNEIAMADLKF